MGIEIHKVSRNFGKFAALDDVSLSIPAGELTALLGPSGSGKTTLLRVMAGLEPLDGGAILFHGDDMTGRDVRARRVGFVFQHYALFRHMTVFENVAFGLRVRPRRTRPPEHEIRARVLGLLELVQLDFLASSYPAQLSGGQRQRIALARALAVEPQILLLDEPFGALDAKIRRELRRWLRRLHDQLRVTSVFVTHDQEEAMEVADRVVVMNRGRIEQVGTPDEVYHNPVNPFVYDFIGQSNYFSGSVNGGRVRIGSLEIEAPEHAGAPNAIAVGYARPHDIEIDRLPEGNTVIAATLRRIHVLGCITRLELSGPDGQQIEAELSRERFHELGLRAGERVYVKPRNLRLFIQPHALPHEPAECWETVPAR